MQDFELYDTLRGGRFPFRPAGERATIYACGITPYDTTHVGHLFTYLAVDVLLRHLQRRGVPTAYVQNLTDIDDAILRASRQRGEEWKSLGRRWARRYIEDMKLMNVLAPDEYPRATETIPEIVRAIDSLVRSGFAYASGGGVYFEISRFSEYGKLSRLSPEAMQRRSNETGDATGDPRKKDPLDFTLWVPHREGEPSWTSPWGPGRPGWHIECSTMARGTLGDTVDVHAGGADLAFPHHECEIAQSEAASGKHPFVRFWMHVGLVRYQGEKMSKSKGNLVMLPALLDRASPDGIRIHCLRHHYRDSFEHRSEEVRAAEERAARLRAALRAPEGSGRAVDPAAWKTAFDRAMDADLDTPSALAHLEVLAGVIVQAAGEGGCTTAAKDTLRELGGALGLRLDAHGPEERVAAGWERHLRRGGAEPLD